MIERVEIAGVLSVLETVPHETDSASVAFDWGFGDPPAVIVEP
ncbi:hypothetical protein [Halostagnicola bangensis]